MKDNIQMLRFRPLLLLSIACLTTAAFAQSEKKVTYRTVAVPAEVALKELSAKAGVELAVSPNLARNTLLIGVKDVPLKQVMDKIAFTCDGTWETTGTGFRLIPDEAKRKAMLEARRVREFDQLTKELGKRRETAAKLVALDTAKWKKYADSVQQIIEQSKQGEQDRAISMRIADLDKQSPSGRLMGRMMVGIEASDLVKIPEGSRVVFSTNPGRMQRKMPASLLPAINSFVTEQNMWSQVAEQTFPTEGQEDGGIPYYITAYQNRGRIDRISKVLLTVMKQPYGNYQFHVIAADGKGKTIGRGDDSMNAQFTAEDEKLMSEPPKADPNEKEITLSPLSIELKKVAGGNERFRPQTTLPVLSPQLREALLNPEKVDPLSFATSDVLLGIADQKGVNVVANVPDYFFFLNMELGAASFTKPSTFFQMAKMMKIEAAVQDGWFTVHPSNSIFGEITLVNRKSLGPVLRNVVKKGKLTLDDAAAYSLASPDGMMDMIGSLYLGMFDLSAKQLLNDNDRQMLKFYGSMSVYQRQAAQKGESISLRTLSPLQRTVLEAMIFNSDYSPLQLNSSTPTTSPEESEVSEDEDINDWDSILREPTESLPNGIPADGFFTMAGATEDVLTILDEDPSGENYGAPTEMTMDDMALQIFANERPALFPWMNRGSQKRTFEKLRIGSRYQVTFDFTFTPKVSMASILKELTMGTTTVSMAKLPAELKKKLDARVEKMRQDYKEVKEDQNGGGGSAIPPPPPR